MRRALEATAIVGAALAALAALTRYAPGYLSVQGFPVDEAWTAQVFARSLAHTGQLAFNPGAPAPGVTSLAWTALLAAIHALASPAVSVIATKLLGLAIHAAAALVLWHALEAAGAGWLARALGAALVAAHPDLVAASASGLEVPLAALAGCALLRAAQAAPVWPFAVVSAAAPLVRPDLALLAIGLPLLAATRADGARSTHLLAAGAGGCAASLALALGRELALGGALVTMPTAAALQLTAVDAEVIGFRTLLAQIPIADSSLLIGFAAAVAGWRLVGGAPSSAGARAVPAAFLVALGYCVVEFALHPPVPSASGAFGLADQRWPLPVLPLLVGLLPALLVDAARAWLPSRARAIALTALAALLIASVAVHAPRRYMLLASDARTVDELGVAAGRLLASAPPAETIWAVFPGAIRYFGAAQVVDLSGANQPELASPDAARFLAARPPRYIEIVPGRDDLDPASRSRVKAVRLERPEHEVWTGSLPAEERWIVLCAEPGMAGQLTLDYRALPFSCAGPGAAAAR